jgi:Cu/Ag efflux protein CusF
MKLSQLFILPVAIMAAVSCATITGESETTAKVTKGEPGGAVTETTTITAKRRVTMVTRKNEKFTVKAGPEVVNFDQIRIGDQLNAVLIEETVIRMAKPGERIYDEAYGTMGVAEVGAKPGLKMTDTIQYTGTVTAIDTKKRKATLSFEDGSSKKFTVRPDVDLSKHKVGERVVFRSTESYAVSLKKP